jgi:hypothetical protein
MTHSPDPYARNCRSGAIADTIEVELRPSDMHFPAPAAPSDQSGDSSSQATPPEASYDDRSRSTTVRRWMFARIGSAVGTVAAVVAFASVAHHTTPPAAAPPAAVKAANPTQPAPQPAASAGEPVRVKNPFDRSEIFEFPAGTSKEEAHQAVAELLLQRANERRQTLHLDRRRPGRPPSA